MTALQPPARILIVEDDEINRKLLSLLLQKQGYEVVTAATGTDALAYIASGEATPRLVLLDFELPDMTAREIRAAQRNFPAYDHIPVVLMTAHLRGADLARELAVAAYLPKPFVPVNVLALIRQLCSSKVSDN